MAVTLLIGVGHRCFSKEFVNILFVLKSCFCKKPDSVADISILKWVCNGNTDERENGILLLHDFIYTDHTF